MYSVAEEAETEEVSVEKIEMASKVETDVVLFRGGDR